MENNKKAYLYTTCTKCKKKKDATTQSSCPSCRTSASSYVKKERPKAYLSNKDLYCELLVSKAQGKLTRSAEKMMILLGKNIIKKFYYQNPDDKHDCLQNGYVDMFANWYSFDEHKSDNAFAFFTEVFKRSAAKGWNKLHKLRGDDEGLIKIISMDATDEDGNSYARF